MTLPLLAFALLMAVALGPTGLFVAPYLLGLLFLFGYELCRPVFQNPHRERWMASAFHLAGWAFLPLVVYTWYLDNATTVVVAERGQRFGNEGYWVYPVIGLVLSAAASIGSAVVVLWRRGPKGTLRWHLRSLVVAGVGVVLGVGLSGWLWWVAPVLFFAPFAGFLFHAIWRMVNPVRRDRSGEAFVVPMEASAPSFVPFGGGR